MRRTNVRQPITTNLTMVLVSGFWTVARKILNGRSPKHVFFCSICSQYFFFLHDGPRLLCYSIQIGDLVFRSIVRRGWFFLGCIGGELSEIGGQSMWKIFIKLRRMENFPHVFDRIVCRTIIPRTIQVRVDSLAGNASAGSKQPSIFGRFLSMQTQLSHSSFRFHPP